MKTIIDLALTSLLVLLIVVPYAGHSASKPKLVVLITVDQLRGDMPWRFRDRFGPDGFRYLMDNGTSYTSAYYQHSTTFTAVGHATLATGGNTAQHGLAGNDWYDIATGKRVYCVEDDGQTLIGNEPKEHEGSSPRNLTSTTVGDELVLASAGKSRVFSVSLKDRGAILPGGYLGKAFWYSSDSGKFVTSTYYYREYPQWVKDWNAAKHADRYQDETWNLLHDQSSYIFGNQDDRSYEKSYGYLGRTFPHALGNDDAEAFYAALRFTPMGDELTLNFVKELMSQEKLGQGQGVDMLAVSFSATDYIGHAFGPNSLEAEDNLLRLDRTLAELLRTIDRQVGLEQTLLVLSADHGTDAIPEYKESLGIPAGRHHLQRYMTQLNDALQARFNSDEKLVAAFWNPSFYLDLEAVKKLDADVAVVERALAEEIMKIPGFALALTRSDLMQGAVPNTAAASRVRTAFHPTRSGNVLVVQSPSWYLYPKPDAYSAMHGSPYTYDTYVPIMFAGPGITHRKVNRSVAPRDIAPTVTTYLGIKSPSGSVGKPLTEVLD